MTTPVIRLPISVRRMQERRQEFRRVILPPVADTIRNPAFSQHCGRDRVNTAKLIVKLATRVASGKRELGAVRANLRAVLELAGNDKDPVTVRAEVMRSCPLAATEIAQELCDELGEDHTGAWDRLVSDKRRLVNTGG